LRALLRRRHAALPDLSPVSSPINDDAAPAPPSGSLAPGAAVAQWVALWQIVFFIQRVLSHYRAIGYTPYFFSGGHPTELSGIGGWYRQARPDFRREVKNSRQNSVLGAPRRRDFYISRSRADLRAGRRGKGKGGKGERKGRKKKGGRKREFSSL
jgi:hypothetical protein